MTRLKLSDIADEKPVKRIHPVKAAPVSVSGHWV